MSDVISTPGGSQGRGNGFCYGFGRTHQIADAVFYEQPSGNTTRIAQERNPAASHRLPDTDALAPQADATAMQLSILMLNFFLVMAGASRISFYLNYTIKSLIKQVCCICCDIRAHSFDLSGKIAVLCRFSHFLLAVLDL